MFANEQHETSSIGAVWPPMADQYNRLRGFYTEEALDSNDTLRAFTDQFYAARESIEDSSCTRLSIRAIATPALLSTLEDAGIKVEGAIPLGEPYRPLVIAYTGWNAPHRTMSLWHAGQHAEALKSAIAYPLPMDNPTSRLAAKGLTSAFVDKQTREAERSRLTPAFADLYALFGYTAEETETLLLNSDNTIAYATAGDSIVSTAMAERHTISIPRLGDIAIAEITEAVTVPTYRGKGVYRAVSGLLGQLLLETEVAPHAIYGESNLAMPAVLTAGHHNGRHFSYFDRESFGLTGTDFGILPQNVRVHDGVETRPYNDFALSYLPVQ